MRGRLCVPDRERCDPMGRASQTVLKAPWTAAVGGTCSLRSCKDRGVGLESGGVQVGEKRGREGGSFGFAGPHCSMGLLIVALVVMGVVVAARCAMSEDNSGTWLLRSRQSCPPVRSGSPGCASTKGQGQCLGPEPGLQLCPEPGLNCGLPGGGGEGIREGRFSSLLLAVAKRCHCPPLGF